MTDYGLSFSTVVTDGFCETVAFHRPEYSNAFSSILIMLISCAWWYNSSRLSTTMRMIYTCILLNGAASFAYHWTLQWGWGLFDSQTMLFAVCLGNYVMYDDILFRHYVTASINLDLDPDAISRSQRKYHNLTSIVAIATITAFTITTILSVIPLYSTHFSIVFGGLAVALFPGAIIDYRYLRNNTSPINTIVSKYFLIGIITSCIAPLLWMIPEPLCHVYPNIARYVFWTHSLWHILLCYGLCTIAQTILYIHAINEGLKPSIYSCAQSYAQSQSPSCCTDFCKKMRVMYDTLFMIIIVDSEYNDLMDAQHFTSLR